MAVSLVTLLLTPCLPVLILSTLLTQLGLWILVCLPGELVSPGCSNNKNPVTYLKKTHALIIHFLKIKAIKKAQQIKALTTKPAVQFLGSTMVKGENLLVFWPPHVYSAHTQNSNFLFVF